MLPGADGSRGSFHSSMHRCIILASLQKMYTACQGFGQGGERERDVGAGLRSGRLAAEELSAAGLKEQLNAILNNPKLAGM